MLKSVIIPAALMASTALAQAYGYGYGEGSTSSSSYNMYAASSTVAMVPETTPPCESMWTSTTTWAAATPTVALGSSGPPPEVLVQVVEVSDSNGTLRYNPEFVNAPPGSIVQFQFNPKVSHIPLPFSSITLTLPRIIQ